ncbi:hypothetical protein FRC04_006811 [Tulasnella sp. 424]|nr:hypothetical protein FRC04_006811 [Tulasnella sp. 424]
MALITVALAGDCTKIPFIDRYYCGRVINHSKYQMRYVTDPNSSSGKNLCNIWNWSDDGGAIVKCTQKYLNSGSSVGAGVVSRRGTDVDAFCFADRDYFVSESTIVPRGEWTRIHDNQVVTCSGGNGDVPRFTAEERRPGLFVHYGLDFGITGGIKAAFTGIVAVVVSPRGNINSFKNETFLEVHFTFETYRSALFDAVLFVGGSRAEYDKLERQVRLLHAAREVFMHFKTVCSSEGGLFDH